MSTIQIQRYKERTEPKLPSIINKNLSVLPWDWELPSTILMSNWAQKHKQCQYTIQCGSRDDIKLCAFGLLLHYYYGTNGYKKLERLVTSKIYQRIASDNDFRYLSFNEIGNYLGLIRL